MNALVIPGQSAPLEIGPIESAADFKRRVAKFFTPPPPPFKSAFGAMFLDELDAPGEEHEYLIDGILSTADKSVIGGPSQSGKSFLAIHAGMCVATGRDFFGSPVKQGLVIYQVGEGARGVKKRLRAWRKHHEIQYGRNTPFVLLRSAVDLYHPEGDTPKLIAEIQALSKMYDLPLRLIVIDTLATATGGADENSGKDMGLVMANIAKINLVTGAHVCLVHHMNAGGTKLRGHTSIFANVDQVLLVTRNETTKVRTVVLEKQKDDESGGRFQFDLMAVDLAIGADDKPIRSCVCLPLGEKEAIRRTEEVKGVVLAADEVIFMRALFEAEKSHGLPVPADMSLKSDVRAVIPYDDVKRAWAAMQPSDVMPSDGETPEDAAAAKARHREALKKRLQRMRQGLVRWGVVGAGELSGDKCPVLYWTGKPLRAFPHTLPRDVSDGPAPGHPAGEEIPF